jgi:hypothetical protein
MQERHIKGAYHRNIGMGEPKRWVGKMHQKSNYPNSERL